MDALQPLTDNYFRPFTEGRGTPVTPVVNPSVEIFALVLLTGSRGHLRVDYGL